MKKVEEKEAVVFPKEILHGEEGTFGSQDELNEHLKEVDEEGILKFGVYILKEVVEVQLVKEIQKKVIKNV